MCLARPLQKLGFQEESFVIDLKEGNVYKGKPTKSQFP